VVGYYACPKNISDDYFFKGINTLKDLKLLESKFIIESEHFTEKQEKTRKNREGDQT